MEQGLQTVATQKAGGMALVAQSRQAQEVQAAVIMARQFPRDTTTALARILEDCKRKGLAEKAVYEYARGGTKVTGPSIRLAEAIARAWGNMDVGVVEVERKQGSNNQPSESVMQAFSWDLETNTRNTKTFTVRHWRDTKQGGYALKDERDIYELNSNQASRRLRACILAAIPADIVDSAVLACEKTMEGGQGPIIDRVRAMVIYFKDTYQVSQVMIEKYVQNKVEAISEAQLVRLKNIANSLKDGMSKREDYFDFSGDGAEAAAAPTATAPEVQNTKTVATKSITNFAPKTPEAAKEMKQGDVTAAMKDAGLDTTSQEQSQADREKSQKEKEMTAIKIDLCKKIAKEQTRVGWSKEQLENAVQSEFNKPMSDLDNNDLESLLHLFSKVKDAVKK